MDGFDHFFLQTLITTLSEFEISPKKVIIPQGFRNAAVMILFTKEKEHLDVVFIHRSSIVDNHKDQVSFPGGLVEKNETILEAAYRETQEELGIRKEQIQYLARIPQYISPTGVVISPFLGYIQQGTYRQLKITSDEVERVFTIPWRWLVKNDNFHKERYLTPSGQARIVIVYNEYRGETLWGISAVIIQNLLKILNKKGGQQLATKF